MVHKILKRIALLALFTCPPVAEAQIVLEAARPASPWTDMVALDAPDATATWSVVVSSPPPDAIEPPGGFPVLYYLDDEMSLLFADTARRLGGSKRHVVLAGLRPGPGAVRDEANWTNALKRAADVVARMHPGSDRCSTVFVRPGDRKIGIMPPGNGVSSINGYAMMEADRGRSDWRIRFVASEVDFSRPSPSAAVAAPDMWQDVQLHSHDELLALPEGIVRAIEWASACRPPDSPHIEGRLIYEPPTRFVRAAQ